MHISKLEWVTKRAKERENLLELLGDEKGKGERWYINRFGDHPGDAAPVDTALARSLARQQLAYIEADLKANGVIL